MTTPYPGFTAIDYNIYRESLNGAAVHGVKKCHPQWPSHPQAFQSGPLVVLSRGYRLNVDIRAVFCGSVKYIPYQFNRYTLNNRTRQNVVEMLSNGIPLFPKGIYVNSQVFSRQRTGYPDRRHMT